MWNNVSVGLPPPSQQDFIEDVGDYKSFDMLQLRLHLMSLGVDVSDKSDDECLETAQQIVGIVNGAFTKWVEAITPVLAEFVQKLSVAFASLTPLFEDLQPLLEESKDDYQHAVKRTKQDVENKRRMQRGGKWKAF